MKKRYLIIAVSLTLFQGCYVAPPYHASSRVSVGIGHPGVHIGVNFSTYPDLVLIPGYPVYYAHRLNSNYFFYDGLYWVFHGDNWYVSGWYNGPWNMVSHYDVPVFVLRIPVRYYRLPPPYFRGWHADAPPRWGDHWGRDWAQRRSGWDHWDRRSVPSPAPLPTYQRNYSGDRYPHAVEQQHAIRSENYRYQPRDPVAQEHFQQRREQDQQRERDQQRQFEQQRQQEQQRQFEQQRQQDQQRQFEQQRQQEQQRQFEQQRQPEQPRPQDQQRGQSQQRQPEQPRPQDQQRGQSQQRQLEQPSPQDQQRGQSQQRQPEQPRSQQDRERQRSKSEPKDKDTNDKAAPQDRIQEDTDDKQQYEQKKKGDAERNQNR